MHLTATLNIKKKLACYAAILLLIFSVRHHFLNDADASTEAKSSLQMTVEIINSTAQPYRAYLPLYGKTKPFKNVMIRAEIDSVVEEIFPVEGTIVEKGTPLLRLEVEGRDSSLAQAKAELARRQADYKIAKSLAQSGHQANIKKIESYAALKQASAALEKAKLELGRSGVYAPFAGLVEEIHVEEGDSVKRKESLLATMIDNKRMKVSSFVPEKYLSQLDKKAYAIVNLADGNAYQAEILRASHIADETTRSFHTELVINDAKEIAIGMTAKVKLPLTKRMAHHLPESLLTLNNDGVIGIKVLDTDNTVNFYPITLHAGDTKGVWVSGLPTEARVISRGQNFVRTGDEVAFSEAPL